MDMDVREDALLAMLEDALAFQVELASLVIQ